MGSFTNLRVSFTNLGFRLRTWGFIYEVANELRFFPLRIGNLFGAIDELLGFDLIDEFCGWLANFRKNHEAFVNFLIIYVNSRVRQFRKILCQQVCGGIDEPEAEK